MQRINIVFAIVLLCNSCPWRKWQTTELGSPLWRPIHMFVAGSVNNLSGSYCPYYGDVCQHSYNVEMVSSNISDGAYPACCERCESVPSKMRCCSEIMPCKDNTSNDQGESLVCIRTVSELYDIGVLAVASCPEHSSGEQQMKCVQRYNSFDVDIHDVMPVRDVTTHTLYRNKYCAFCNGVDIANVKFWNLNVGCHQTVHLSITTDSNLLKTIHRHPACFFTFKDPQTPDDAEMCTLSIASCNEIDLFNGHIDFGKPDQQTCSAHVKDEVVHAGILFRNRNCASCNGIDTPSDRELTLENPSFSLLLTVDEQKKFDDPHPPSRCERGAVFNRAKRQCAEARCSFLRQLRGNACERILPNPDSFAYRIGFRLFPENRFQNRSRHTAITVDTAFYELPIEFENKIRNLLLSVFPSTKWMVFEMLLAANVEHNNLYNSTEILRGNLVFYEVRVKLAYSETHDPEEKLLEMIGLEDSATLDIVKGQHNISFKLMLTDDKTHFMALQNSQDPHNICHFSFDIFYQCQDLRSSETFKIYQLENLTAVPFAGIFDRYISPEFLSTPITNERSILELRRCPFVKLTRREMDWTATEFGLEFLFNNSTALMKSSEYVYGESSDVIWMCLETYEQSFGLTDGSVDCLSRVDYTFIGIIVSLAVYSTY